MVTRNAAPLYVERDNLSLAWGEVLLRLLTPGITAITPLTLSITGFASDGTPIEASPIRDGLEQLLKTHDVKADIETVAFTIFPNEYWQLANHDRAAFISLYRESFPRIQDWNARNNARGSYFQRLVDYEGANKGRDQLDWIIKEYLRRPKQRVSQFLATTFDPHRDHTRSAQLGFPCLQQVSFVPLDDGGLVMNATYATQQILRKAYGNYLGLCRLGNFMAGEMGLRFARLNVFVGVAQMDNKIARTDRDLKGLEADITKALALIDTKTRAA
jgi:hypothetical protein